MKKLLVVLLSLGLLVAFGATASAADVKFGGSYYVVGVYENNPGITNPWKAGAAEGPSKALFYQRVRLQPVFAIAEGLTFTARMDALEKQWGQTDWKTGYDDLTATRGNKVATPKRGIQESFEFERGYVTFMTKIGVFQIGYQNVDDWGTDFGDYSNTRPRAAFSTKVGPMTLNATYEKVFEADTASQTGVGGTIAYPGKVDADNDTYALSAIYSGKGIEAGLLYKYYAFNSQKPEGVKTKMTQVSPYAKLTFGPVYVEGEATYWFGKYAEYEAPLAGTADVDLSAWSAYLKGQMNMGPAFFGALFAYVGGNDLSDTTKWKVPPSGGGTNFAPALILMNDALNTWTGGVTAAKVNDLVTTSKFNISLYNVFGGFSPTPKLKLEAALTYAMVNKKSLSATTEAVSDKLGTEFDVKATYKIYDNLTYMVGAGYLWAGDYFKGTDDTKKVDNDYLLLNQLTLSF